MIGILPTTLPPNFNPPPTTFDIPLKLSLPPLPITLVARRPGAFLRPLDIKELPLIPPARFPAFGTVG